MFKSSPLTVSACTCAVALVLGTLSPVAAQTTHHYRHHARVAPVAAPIARNFTAQYAPEVVMGPSTPAWRYNLLRGGCRHAYPMLESASCATATGGPAGSIN